MMFGEAPKEIPKDLFDRYSLNSKLHEKTWYIDQTEQNKKVNNRKNFGVNIKS